MLRLDFAMVYRQKILVQGKEILHQGLTKNGKKKSL
jgi:hypothetical protein